jgi:hypothetical protein
MGHLFIAPRQDNIPLEVVPKVYIGSIHAAFNQEAITERSITHVSPAPRTLNAQYRGASHASTAYHAWPRCSMRRACQRLSRVSSPTSLSTFGTSTWTDRTADPPRRHITDLRALGCRADLNREAANILACVPAANIFIEAVSLPCHIIPTVSCSFCSSPSTARATGHQRRRCAGALRGGAVPVRRPRHGLPHVVAGVDIRPRRIGGEAGAARDPDQQGLRAAGL